MHFTAFNNIYNNYFQEHSEVFAQFRDEYAELSPEAKVDDKELHDLLVRFSSSTITISTLTAFLCAQ